MTGFAILLRRRVGFFPGQLLLDRFVTIEAKIGALRQEQFVELCLVGAMALGAVAVEIRGMFPISLLEPFVQLIMASGAQILLILDDHPSDVAGMGIMTGQTLSIGKGLMVRPHTFRFHECGMAWRT